MAHDTRSDVRTVLENYFSDAEVEETDIAGGIRAVIPEDDVGRFFGLARREGYSFESRRVGGVLVAHISAEETEEEGLGELFG